MQRILVVGSPGAGKSTLAHHISAHTGLPLRILRADTVVWLDYPTRLCLWRAVRRWWQYRDRTRPNMTEGCPERFNLEFFLYVLMFRATWQSRNGAAIRQFSGSLYRFKTPAETALWLGGLGAPTIPG